MKSSQLTCAAITKEFPEQKPENIKELNLKNRNLQELDNLATFRGLQKVNLSNNLFKACEVNSLELL